MALPVSLHPLQCAASCRSSAHADTISIKPRLYLMNHCLTTIQPFESHQNVRNCKKIKILIQGRLERGDVESTLLDSWKMNDTFLVYFARNLYKYTPIHY